MKHGDLFAGIGGFGLAARWIGWQTVFHCEIIEYNKKILHKHFPDAKQHSDIRDTDFTIYRNRIDVLTGGFPCQDISTAGRGEGIFGGRSGLWSEFKRAIYEINPQFAVIENSPNLLTKGIEKVLYDLSEIGYDAEWECISAKAFGFPDKRERLFIVAYPAGFRQPGQGNIFENARCDKEERDWKTNDVIHAIQRQTLPPLCNSNYGFPERVVKDGVKTSGNAALFALGNAVKPQIPFAIFKAIQSHANTLRT